MYRRNSWLWTHWIGLCSALCPCQHSIGYTGEGFTGQKTQPTVSKYWRRCYKGKSKERKQLNHTYRHTIIDTNNKAQLSLTNPCNAKACQKLLQFDVLTTLSLTILAYLHAFSCCCVQNLQNPEKFTENSNLWSSRSSKVIDLGANQKPMYDFLLVANSNFGRICYCFRDIDAWNWKIADFTNSSRL